MLRHYSEMTNQYLTAFAEDPIIRGAVMQSADSENTCFSVCRAAPDGLDFLSAI